MTKAPFELIVEQHGATVLRVCRAVLGPHEAQDAWSETFLSALRAYPGLAEGANIQAWLVTIAHRKAIDITRSRSREPVPVESLPERSRTDRGSHPGSAHLGSTDPGSTDPGSTDPGRNMDRDQLWTDVAALPTKQRQAIAYHYLAGLPHKEVAEIVGGSTDAARRAAADGIAALRRQYARVLEPNGYPR